MMRRGVLARAWSLSAALTASAACGDATGPGPVPRNPERSLAGGETTVFDGTSHAFSLPAPNLSASRLEDHLAGDLAFEQIFVRAGSEVNPGLGPIFNASSCNACHDRDGRTRGVSLLRLSLAGGDASSPPSTVPGFGTQLQDESVFGVPPEGEVRITWVDVPGAYADGTTYTLRRPLTQVVQPYQALPAGVHTSLRTPRPVFGLGLLEAVPDAAIVDLEDPADADGDNVSGRANRVASAVDGRLRIGRFGWKANQATLVDQVAAAYREDMGVTSSVRPTESAAGQDGQDDGSSDDPELAGDVLLAATLYVQTLGVPAARDLDNDAVVRGEGLFRDIGCATCHVPRLETGVLEGVPEVSHQTVFPYTDLLLHDMGPELADGRRDWRASGSEWRTPPLWGLGLMAKVNGHTELLHDGRARSPEEAILWHGGEALPAREAFRSLPAGERLTLLAFLNSL